MRACFVLSCNSKVLAGSSSHAQVGVSAMHRLRLQLHLRGAYWAMTAAAAVPGVIGMSMIQHDSVVMVPCQRCTHF